MCVCGEGWVSFDDTETTYQRHLEQRRFLPEIIKLGAGDHGPRIKVQHAERLAERHVILGLEIKGSLAANFRDQLRLLLGPDRHVGMRRLELGDAFRCRQETDEAQIARAALLQQLDGGDGGIRRGQHRIED